MNGGEHRIWKKINNEMKIEKVIQPKPNLLLASIQNNVGFHDVNPITYIEGSRKAFFMAISASCKIWKSLEDNHFNRLYNPNRTQVYTKRRPLSSIKDKLLGR